MGREKGKVIIIIDEDRRLLFHAKQNQREDKKKGREKNSCLYRFRGGRKEGKNLLPQSSLAKDDTHITEKEELGGGGKRGETSSTF